MEKDDRMSLRLPKQMKQDLQALATKSKRKLNDYMVLVLEDVVKQKKTV